MTFALENERQKSTVAVAVVFCILPTVSYGLRLWSRRIQKVLLDPSDYCALGALVSKFVALRCILTLMTNVEYRCAAGPFAVSP